MPTLDTLRIIGSGGANRAMEAEIKRLARRGIDGWREVKPQRVDPQTLVYPYSDALAWLCTHYLRTPSRVLWDQIEAKAGRLEPLFDEVREWVVEYAPEWLTDGATISVRARDVRDFPASGSQIQGTIKNALIEGAADLGRSVRLAEDGPDVDLSVRGTGGPLVLSVDLAGRSLHERGYRRDRVDAPLRENLAAQILMLARWDARTELLIDPMAGSGTIAIEAASMAKAAPLWIGRQPAMRKLARFAAHEEAAPLFADASPRIISNDIESKAMRVAERNIARAGVEADVLRIHGHFADLTADRVDDAVERARPAWSPLDLDRGLIVCNPPYGERLGQDPVDLYQEVRDWIDQFGEGWRAAFLVAQPDFERIIGRTPKMKKPMSNGQLPAQLYIYDLG